MTTGQRETKQSAAAFERALHVMPGGVNSPVRAFRAVGGTPFFADRGVGPYIYDIDGNRYIDYLLSWGPLILGHAPANVLEAVTAAAAKGTSFGIPTELESDMAELVTEIVPSIEVVRMVNSGTEATMSALRLARAFTKRELIVKFEGCYHGHADHLLVKAGSGVATFGLPDSPGVPTSVAENTLSVAYNDVSALTELFAQRGAEIAAIIVEPVAGNMGLVLPDAGFLQAARALTTRYGSLLIFDEVMSGFRVSLGGAGAYFGIQADLTTLGKVIGGGLPVGAYGGRRDIMALVAPQGPVYQAGTLSGNPLAMAAGFTTLKTLQQLDAQGLYDRLYAYGGALIDTFVTEAKAKGIAALGHHIGAMFGLFFSSEPVVNFATASGTDRQMYARFFHNMLDAGVALAPSGLEAGFLASVHNEETLAQTQQAIRDSIQAL